MLATYGLHYNAFGIAPPGTATTYWKYVQGSWQEEAVVLTNKQRTGAGTLDVQTLGQVGKKWQGLVATESKADRDTFLSKINGTGANATVLLITPNGESFAVSAISTGVMQMRNNNKERWNIPVEFEWI